MLDFQKVKQAERERAGKLAASAAGAAMEADARLEAHAMAESSDDIKMSATYSENGGSNGEANTFDPGAGQTSEQTFATQFSVSYNLLSSIWLHFNVANVLLTCNLP